MYRILIADDEPFIRQNLVKLVNEQLRDNAEIYQAVDGREALELFRIAPCDIVITDIKMAYKDGLELIKDINGLNPDTAFIIVSGFGEFEYAKKAIEYKVIKYLLKPINRNELKQALDAAVELLKMKEEKHRMSEENIKNRQRLLEQLFQNAVLGKESRDPEPEFLEAYRAVLPLPCYTVIVLDFFNKGYFRLQNYKERANSIKKAVDFSLAGHCSHYISFFSPDYALVVVINSEGVPPGTLFHTILRENRSLSDNCYATRLFAGISGASEDIRGLQQQYLQARKAADYKKLYSDRSVFFYREIAAKKSVLNIPGDIFAQIKEAVEMNDKKQISTLVDALFKEELLQAYTLECSQRLFEGLMNYLFINIVNANPLLRTQSSINELFAMKFEDFGSISELPINIKRICYFICDGFSKDDAAAGYDRLIIQKALNYINKNYNKNISMSTVANYINMNYHHFSKIFKDETGENYVDYMTTLRISKAKDLLKDPSMDIKAISEQVGYTSPRHFSRLFKQSTGFLPSEYRRKIGIPME